MEKTISLSDDALQKQLLQDLHLLNEAIYSLLPDAAQDSLPHFRDRARPIDRALLSHMIRNEMKYGLRNYGFDVDDDSEDVDFDLHSLSLSGLEGSFNGYSFKIRKAAWEDGQVRLPAAGTSDRAQRFYGQQLSFDVVDDRFIPQPPRNKTQSERPNIVYLWDLGPNFSKPSLWCAVPSQGGETRESTRARFIIDVPHPATTISQATELPIQGQPAEPPVNRKHSTLTPAPSRSE